MTRYPVYIRIDPLPGILRDAGTVLAVLILGKLLGNFIGDVAMVFAEPILKFFD